MKRVRSGALACFLADFAGFLFAAVQDRQASIAELSQLISKTSVAPSGRKRVLPGTVTPMRPVPPQIERPDYALSGMLKKNVWVATANSGLEQKGKPIGELKQKSSHVVVVHSAEESQTMAKVCRVREIWLVGCDWIGCSGLISTSSWVARSWILLTERFDLESQRKKSTALCTRHAWSVTAIRRP
jgi:hypothetical protein